MRVSARKYPRVCGEEFICAPSTEANSEIPPRLRGRDLAIGRPRALLGNTPASAGKRTSSTIPTHPLRKYPRVCGEESAGEYQLPGVREIPPRLRGRALSVNRPAVATGNTPASAGKRHPSYPASERFRKYPRVCGEELLVLVQVLVPLEIPPRLRGRVPPLLLYSYCDGNTPASAGKRNPASSR